MLASSCRSAGETPRNGGHREVISTTLPHNTSARRTGFGEQVHGFVGWTSLELCRVRSRRSVLWPRNYRDTCYHLVDQPVDAAGSDSRL